MVIKSMTLGALSTALFAASLVPAFASDLRVAEAERDGDTTTVRVLLKQHTNVNVALGDGTTALHWAVSNGDLEQVNLLLKSGADVKAKTRIGAITPLEIAATNGDGAIVSALLKAGADANAPAENGTTPLMSAAASGNTDAVVALLAHGAKINAVESIYGQTALIFAAAKDRGDVIRTLIKHGADPKIASKVSSLGRVRQEDDNDPPEQAAADGAATSGADGARSGRRRRPAADTDGAAGGASVAAPAADSGTAAIDSAGTSSANGTVRRRRAASTDGDSSPDAPTGLAGGDVPGAAAAGAAGGFGGFGGRGGRGGPSTRTFGGNTALVIAAREGHIGAVKALLESGADINEANAGDKTPPITMAICNGHYDVARYLLDHGADPNQKNIDGLPPLYAVIDTEWAPRIWSPTPITEQETNNYLALMKALIEHGADVNARITRKLWFRPAHHNEAWVDQAGSTAFWRAAQAEDLPAMQLLENHGADPTIATNTGVNALMVAAGVGWNGNFNRQTNEPAIDSVKYLLGLGVDALAVDAQGYTALAGAAYRGDNDLINFLVQNGAKLDTRTSRNWTLTDMANGPSLRSSVPVPHPDSVALLLKLGAPPLTPTDNEEILGIIRQRRSGGAGGGRFGGGQNTIAAANPAVPVSVPVTGSGLPTPVAPAPAAPAPAAAPTP